MKYEQEAKLRAMQEEGGVASGLGARDTLLGRLQMRNQHAQQEMREHEMRGELLYLLEEHPKIARILDLYEQVGR